MTVMNETSSFIKKMASPDSKIRDRAVRTVQTFLGNKGDSLNYDEYMKLWKGFFFCFWLSDKTEGQFSLAELIAKLVHNLPVEKRGDFSESGAALFLRSFWETMGREWPRLDRLRLNKYYNLMKNVIHQSFQMIAIASETEDSVSWNSDLVRAYGDILKGTVFDYSNKAYPDSIRCFVTENYFELLKSCTEEPFSAEMTISICEPIIYAVAYCESKAFFKQSSEALIQGLLPGDSDEEDDENVEDLEENDNLNEKIDSENESTEGITSAGSKNDLEISEISAEEMEFDSEEFDNIKDDGLASGAEDHLNDTDSDDEQEEAFIFDYSLLGKFIFDFGARENVLVRNRRFLYELSQIIEEVVSGSFESCCSHEGETCCK